MGDANQATLQYLGGPPEAGFDNAIVRALRDKLERNNRIRRFKDYEKLHKLGKVRGTQASALRPVGPVGERPPPGICALGGPTARVR